MTNPQAEVSKTLDSFHQAASEAKFDEYFNHFAKDAMFIGTDASERWTVKEFKTYAKPAFQKGKGWTYKKRTRNIFLSPDQKFAWFDELLDNEVYGTSRGTGVLIQENSKWKVAQYHLTFPVPNDMASRVTKEIKAHESSLVNQKK